jgi:hypothetical protein
MFLQPSDFAVEGDKYLIPNILTGDVDYEDYIDSEEEDILRTILGDVLYEQFIIGINEVIPDQKWVDLRDGAFYTYNSKQYKYRGLIYTLKPYIYSQWISDNFNNLAALGVVLPTVENGETISPATEIVLAYNEFVSRLGGVCKRRNTMYGFLDADPVFFSDWDFDCEDVIEEINTWNI